MFKVFLINFHYYVNDDAEYEKLETAKMVCVAKGFEAQIHRVAVGTSIGLKSTPASLVMTYSPINGFSAYSDEEVALRAVEIN